MPHLHSKSDREGKGKREPPTAKGSLPPSLPPWHLLVVGSRHSRGAELALIAGEEDVRALVDNERFLVVERETRQRVCSEPTNI